MMRKPVLAALGVGLSLSWLAPDPAEAQRRVYSNGGVKKVYRTYPSYRRPASVGSNGLCQRDTGTPTGQLNFRNRCDTEEFWNRTMQGGRRR